MNIFKNTVVTLKYSLFDAEDKLIEESKESIVYLHGGYENIFPKVESALGSKEPGDKISVTMEPEDAFGEFDESLIRIEDTSKFPATIKIGDQFEGVADHGDHEHATVYTITDIADGKVVTDGNHPLAGVRLRFDCEVMDVRPASKEEIMHGHVHGEHGHHH